MKLCQDRSKLDLKKCKGTQCNDRPSPLKIKQGGGARAAKSRLKLLVKERICQFKGWTLYLPEFTLVHRKK